ncbi:hypothetical protein C8Q74DRAFT_1372913 [Fomes fomentarius]|nr:hypothetical protein C8Q74DRAFT_1372913 [Fomes fomentarius]
MSFVLLASAALTGLVFRYFIGDSNKTSSKDGQTAYILENVVTHARLLPTPSAHDFAYPTLAFLLPLDALESHALDLGRGWLFGYGGTSWRVTGLRSAAYLSPDAPPTRTGTGSGGRSRSIKEKLREVLTECGHDAARLGEAWMLTMPSYMGYEGINPLTVHYCYEKDGERELAWVVLEIHNTFGEKHVHLLESGVDEDEEEVRAPGYEHQWTFARDFHVSPFNDRLGHYRVSVSAPPAPSSPSHQSSPSRPKIRIHLHEPPAPSPLPSPAPDSDQTEGQHTIGPLKLRAILYARHAVPLTSATLLGAVARYPFALFLSFVRILYHAWILHYEKQLDVFPRPDPKPAMRDWADLSTGSSTGKGEDSHDTQETTTARTYGGIGWQDEGPLEAYARRVVERFLRRRASELGTTVALVSGDPSVPKQVFAPGSTLSSAAVHDSTQSPPSSTDELVIHYTAPRFFTTLLLAPSAAHMLLLGRTEDLFRVSSELLFARVFAPPRRSPSFWARRDQSARVSLLPGRFVRSAPIDSNSHPLDDDGGVWNLPVIYLLHAADALEKTVFTSLKARFVPGLEPWGRWERAAVVE